MRMQSVEAKEITEAEEGLSGVKRNRMDHRWEGKLSRGVFLLSPTTHQLAARYRRSLIPSR